MTDERRSTGILGEPHRLTEVNARFPDVRSLQSLTGHLLKFTSTFADMDHNEELPKTFRTIMSQMAQIIEVDAIMVMLRPRQTTLDSDFKKVVTVGLTSHEEEAFAFFVEREVAPLVLKSRKPVRLSDSRSRWLDGSSYGLRTKLVSLVAAPMIFADQIIGILIATRGEIDGFHSDDEPVFQYVANFIAEDLERSWQYANIVKDYATGFYHRQMMGDFLAQEVARSRRYQAPLSLMMIDIDGFSSMRPQTSGAQVDDILRKVAKRISSEVRQTDIGVRASDNAFMLIQPMTSIGNATDLALRLRAKFNQLPILLNEVSLKIALSFGISSLQLSDDDAFALISRTDSALAAAKRLGGNQIVVDDS